MSTVHPRALPAVWYKPCLSLLGLAVLSAGPVQATMPLPYSLSEAEESERQHKLEAVKDHLARLEEMHTDDPEALRKALDAPLPFQWAEERNMLCHAASTRAGWADWPVYQELMKRLLALGADPDWADPVGYRPLHGAVLSGDPRRVSMLLVKKVGINYREPFTGYTPFLLALFHSFHPHQCLLFLDHPTLDIGLGLPPTESLLHLLIRGIIEGRRDFFFVLEALLRTGKCDVNTPHPLSGATPLYMAAANGSIDLQWWPRVDVQHYDGIKARLQALLELLLSQERIDLWLPDHQRRTPLHAASYVCRFDVAAMLLAAERERTHPGKPLSPFRLFLEQVQKDTLDAPFLNNPQDLTLLMVAAGAFIEGHKDARRGCIAELIRLGADVNKKSKEELTALAYACHGADPEVVKMLLQAPYSEVNARVRGGYTALGHAISCYLDADAAEEEERTLEIIQAFLEDKRVDVAHCSNHRSPLMLAILLKKEKLSECLLATDRVDVNLEDEELGLPPLQAAVLKGHLESVALLLSHKQTNISQQNSEHGRTALHYAVLGLAPDLLKRLLQEKDLDVNSRDIKGMTPLTFFLWGYSTLKRASKKLARDHISIFLADKRVDVNLPCQEGKSPLLYAIEGRSPELVRLLLRQESIAVNTKGPADVTALICASEAGSPEVVEMLLADGRMGREETQQASHLALEKEKAAFASRNTSATALFKRTQCVAVADKFRHWASRAPELPAHREAAIGCHCPVL